MVSPTRRVTVEVVSVQQEELMVEVIFSSTRSDDSGVA